MMMISRASRVLLLLALSLWLLAVPAAGHSELVKSQPEAGANLSQTPAQAIGWFSEELDTKTSTIQVFDAAQQQVDLGDGSVDLNDPDHASMIATLKNSLPDGVYTVHWTAVSAEDGDATEGEFTFSVGDAQAAGPASPTATADDSTAGWPLLWLIVGVAVLLAVVVAFSWRWLPGRGK